MNRETIRSRFRSENPEITARVVTDDVLNGWMLDADKDICAETRCIISNVPETFNTVADTQYYDLTANISKFFDIDEYPGGGVWYDDEPLQKASEAEMNYILRNWKNPTSGTPRKYFRRGQYLWFDVPPDAVEDVDISAVYISDDFGSDGIIPYNQLTYLEPFHPGVLKYLQWKAKMKVGKDEEHVAAQREYYTFVKRMKKSVSGGQNNEMYLTPRSNSGNSNSGYRA